MSNLHKFETKFPAIHLIQYNHINEYMQIIKKIHGDSNEAIWKGGIFKEGKSECSCSN